MDDTLDDFESWLLQGKFEPQFSLVSQVRRSTLLHRLDASLAGVLTLVVTPAGYGKSTLLSQWADELKEAGLSKSPGSPPTRSTDNRTNCCRT